MMKEQSKKPLPNIISTSTARTHFGQVLARVTQGQEQFVITSRGEPQVIIMSIEQFKRLTRFPKKHKKLQQQT